MGISKHARATYGWCTDWNLIETEVIAEVPSCEHIFIEKVPLSGTNHIIDLIPLENGERFCSICGKAKGWKKEYSRFYTDIVEEVDEDDIDGYYVTCKGYPVWKSAREYQADPDLAYIGVTISEGMSTDLLEDDMNDMARALSPIFGAGPKLFVWTEYF